MTYGQLLSALINLGDHLDDREVVDEFNEPIANVYVGDDGRIVLETG